MGKLIRDGNQVYEIDEECIREREQKERSRQMDKNEIMKERSQQRNGNRNVDRRGQQINGNRRVDRRGQQINGNRRVDRRGQRNREWSNWPEEGRMQDTNSRNNRIN